MIRSSSIKRCPLVHLAALFGLAAVVPMACTPSDGEPAPGDGELSGLISFFSNIRLSGDQRVTVVYSASEAATDVAAFYVEVESTAVDAPVIGAKVVFATGLPTGDNRTVNLETGAIPIGLYRIGLNLASATETLEILSLGTFEITELPDPFFTQPDQNLIVVPGTDIEIRATLGDPENAVQWRLFYLDASASIAGVPVDQIGVTIATGAANEAIVVWNTSDVALATYRIGISVTDTGQSIAQTVANGDEDRIITEFHQYTVQLVEEVPPPRPPTVVVSQPASDRSILAEETLLIEFKVTVFEGPPSVQSVTVFYDFDGVADTGDEVPISTDLPITATNVVFSGGLIEEGETVHAGVTADDGRNDPVTAYAAGRITVTTLQDATLQVTQPSSPLPRGPGEVVNVAWQTTNLPTGADAKVDVFMRRVDATGSAVGAEMQILAPSPLTTTSTSFVTALSGRFRVTVRIIFEDETIDPLTDDAPAFVVVSTLPGIVWLGELAAASPSVSGAIFEGVQFEDNAGAAFAGDEDFDGDGLDEMIIVSRYAKPEFVNPTGVGAGEAYMIRGSAQRDTGRLNLNSVGGPVIPGFVFTGIEPDPETAPNDTDGIASVFITEDADGDDVGEIVFGFPRVFSQQFYKLGGPSRICKMGGDDLATGLSMSPVVDPQFARGGVVIVSSRNTQIESAGDDTAGFSCPLDHVGQRFEVHEEELPDREPIVSPEPGEGPLCSGATSWMQDQLEWTDGECDGPDVLPAERIAGCVASDAGDSEQETLSQPRFGFDPRLADPYPCEFGIPCTREDLPAGCPSSDPAGTDCDRVQLDPTKPLCSPTLVLGLPESEGGTCEADREAAQQSFPLGQAWIERFYGQYLSGYYRERLEGVYDEERTFAEDPNWTDIVRQTPSVNRKSLVGCRIIGRSVNEAFGTSITQSDDNLIVSSPYATVEERTNSGIGYTKEDFHPVTGVDTGLPLPRLWQLPEDLDYDARDYPDNNSTPPRPHQYLAGGNSHRGVAPGEFARGHRDAGGLKIFGDSGEQIQNVVGIPDFNEDGRVDLAVGAPLADVDSNGTPDGAVYIIVRRAEALEGDYDLADLKRAVDDPERLAGVLVREKFDDGQRFGESIAGDFDFNHDDVPDVVVGNPDGNGGTGEVVIILGNRDLISPENGIPVENEGLTIGLLTQLGGARITGAEVGSEFGFNVANIGDFDGDGLNDLAIAAPNASPMMDADPNDGVDLLDTPGLDFDLDGIPDNVTGPTGIPDFVVDENDELRHAGLVYVILSSTDTADFSLSLAPMDISISALGTIQLQGFIIVGRRGERYVGATLKHEGDFLGGGDAGQTGTVTIHGRSIRYGGNAAKAPDVTTGRLRGRSFGLGQAGDVDGDGLDDLLLGAQLADPRVNQVTGTGTRNGGEAYLIYGFRP